MANYRVLGKKFWKDSKVRTLAFDERLFFACCITGPEACNNTQGTGIFEICMEDFEKYLGIDGKRVEEIIDKFNKIGDLFVYDKQHQIIFIKSFPRYNCNYKTLAQAIKHDYELTGHKVREFWIEFVEKNRKEIEKIYNDLPEKDLEEHQYWLNLLSLKDKHEDLPKTEVEKSVAVKFSMQKSLNR